MPDYRLLFTDLDNTSANYGAPMVLSPGSASGVPIPAMQVGTTLPAAGTQVGQAFYLLGARQGYAWTGSNWQPLSSTPLVTYTTEARLLAATGDTPGTYATAGDTGNLFVRQATGWRQLGVRSYNTAAALLADTPAVGSLGEALDEGSLWERLATGWRCLVMREMADTAAVLAWAAGAATGGAVGDRAVDVAHDVMYARAGTGWLPVSVLADTEANIRAAAWALVGQEAIATDTGRVLRKGTTGWLEEPIQHYATQALLLAATPPDGTLAWADDNNEAFTRAAGAWHALANGTKFTAGTTAPPAPQEGEQWLDKTDPASQVLKVWANGGWQPLLSATPAGKPTYPVRLVAQGGLDHHFYWTNKNDQWLRTHWFVSKLTDYAPIGHTIKVEVTANCAGFHMTTVTMRGGAMVVPDSQGVSEGVYAPGMAQGVETPMPSRAGLYHATTFVVDATTYIQMNLEVYLKGDTNCDFQVWGDFFVYDMGPASGNRNLAIEHGN